MLINKKAIRSGYDIDILPSDLITYGNDAKRLLLELQNHNERMFVITILFTNIEKSRKKLSNVIFQLNSIIMTLKDLPTQHITKHFKNEKASIYRYPKKWHNR